MSEDSRGPGPATSDQVRLLEERVARLEAAVAGAAGSEPVAPAAVDAAAGLPDPAVFWALRGLRARASEPGAVLFTGAVSLPGGEHWEWQEGHPVDSLLDDDWRQSAASLSALAHPVRLLLLREVMLGTRTAAELSEHPSLGTSGQLYHHLRQLVAAGWLRSSTRGQYAVPGERVVPLLTVLAATRS